MKDTLGFLHYDRKTHLKRDALSRIKDNLEQTLPLDLQTLQEQALRCSDCGIPFCHGTMDIKQTGGCPLHNLIPEWNELVSLNKMEEAYKRLSLTNPFPEFTARVCPAPCESSCTNGIHYEPVSIKAIEYEIQDFAFSNDLVNFKTPKPLGYRIAIIGSGPSGLSAAHYLSLYGYDVTIYEKDKLPGGLLQYGIPNMKLDKSIVKRRIDLLKAQGVTFITNTTVGQDITFSSIQKDYDKVIIAVGTPKARDLDIEGRNLQGIHMALDYLKDSIEETSKITAKNKHVVIIGGGDTGADCLATAIRQNATSITQLEITPQKPETRQANNPWPQYRYIDSIDYAHQEYIASYHKDPRIFETTVTSFTGKNQVTSLQANKVTWDNGLTITDEGMTYKADLVIIAIGFMGLDEKSKEWTSLDSKDIYVTGDAKMGQSLVVHAIEQGKQTALQIHKDFNKK